MVVIGHHVAWVPAQHVVHDTLALGAGESELCWRLAILAVEDVQFGQLAQLDEPRCSGALPRVLAAPSELHVLNLWGPCPTPRVEVPARDDVVGCRCGSHDLGDCLLGRGVADLAAVEGGVGGEVNVGDGSALSVR